MPADGERQCRSGHHLLSVAFGHAEVHMQVGNGLQGGDQGVRFNQIAGAHVPQPQGAREGGLNAAFCQSGPEARDLGPQHFAAADGVIPVAGRYCTCTKQVLQAVRLGAGEGELFLQRTQFCTQLGGFDQDDGVTRLHVLTIPEQNFLDLAAQLAAKIDGLLRGQSAVEEKAALKRLGLQALCAHCGRGAVWRRAGRRARGRLQTGPEHGANGRKRQHDDDKTFHENSCLPGAKTAA